MPHPLVQRIVALALSALLASCATPTGSARNSEDLVGAARATLDHFEASRGMAPALQSLPQASAIIIFPHAVSASFVVGGSEATGLLFARDIGTGHWVGPVFCSLTEGSVGLQAGLSTAEVLMIVNTAGALGSLFKGHPRLGIDSGVALGKGGGANSAITTDVDSYALTKGLSVGVALDGSVLRIRADLNAAWYGRAATAEDIVARRSVSSPDSGRLAAAIEALSRR